MNRPAIVKCSDCGETTSNLIAHSLRSNIDIRNPCFLNETELALVKEAMKTDSIADICVASFGFWIQDKIFPPGFALFSEK